LGGVLMAAGEVDVGAWNGAVQIRRVPQVRWEARRACLLCALSIAFLIAGFCVPRHFATNRESPLEIGQEIERVKEQVQALKDEKGLDGARADELRQKLDEMKKDGKGTDPGKTLEAIDHVREQAKNRAKAEAEADLKKAEQLAKARELADALRDGKPTKEGGLDVKAHKEGMQELARQLGAAIRDND